MHIRTVLFMSILFAALSTQVAHSADKADVPPEAAQKEALKTIKEVFKDEYKKTKPADIAELSRKLLAQFEVSKKHRP